MSDRTLMIKTKNGRKFLTYEKHLSSLVEFAKTFGAEIYAVEPDAGQKVLELKALTAAICTAEYDGPPKYAAGAKIFPKPKRRRRAILAEAGKIRRYITKRLLAGKPVSLKDLKAKYEMHKLTDACLCNHLSVARKVLSRDGHQFKKIGAGKYCLCQ